MSWNSTFNWSTCYLILYNFNGKQNETNKIETKITRTTATEATVKMHLLSLHLPPSFSSSQLWVKISEILDFFKLISFNGKWLIWFNGKCLIWKPDLKSREQYNETVQHVTNFDWQQVNQDLISSIAKVLYEFPHELSSDLKFRTLGN